jgi:hypothetical protein
MDTRTDLLRSFIGDLNRLDHHISGLTRALDQRIVETRAAIRNAAFDYPERPPDRPIR